MLALIPRRARVRGAERARLAAEMRGAYEGGESIRALAESTGRSYGWVRAMLLEAGTRLRGRGGLPSAGR